VFSGSLLQILSFYYRSGLVPTITYIYVLNTEIQKGNKLKVFNTRELIPDKMTNRLSYDHGMQGPYWLLESVFLLGTGGLLL
jgi:hypothetical protein